MSEKPQSTPKKQPKGAEAERTNDAVRALALFEQARDTGQCKSDKASRAVCKLADSREFNKLRLIAKLANQLCEKFLCKLWKIKFEQADVMGNLNRVQGLPQWKEVMKHLDGAKSFEIKVAKHGKSAEITFKYESGVSKRLIVWPEPEELSPYQQAQHNKAFEEMFTGGDEIQQPPQENSNTEPSNGPKITGTRSKNIIGVVDNLKYPSDPKSIRNRLKKLTTPDSVESYIWEKYPNLLSAEGVKDVSRMLADIAHLRQQKDFGNENGQEVYGEAKEQVQEYLAETFIPDDGPISDFDSESLDKVFEIYHYFGLEI